MIGFLRFAKLIFLDDITDVNCGVVWGHEKDHSILFNAIIICIIVELIGNTSLYEKVFFNLSLNEYFDSLTIPKNLFQENRFHNSVK